MRNLQCPVESNNVPRVSDAGTATNGLKRRCVPIATSAASIRRCDIASRHGYEVAHTELALFNMKTDPGEKTNVADQHPDVVARLSKLAEGIRSELGDELTGTKGDAIRAAGDVAVK